jgi:hypothetical protein
MQPEDHLTSTCPDCNSIGRACEIARAQRVDHPMRPVYGEYNGHMTSFCGDCGPTNPLPPTCHQKNDRGEVIWRIISTESETGAAS